MELRDAVELLSDAVHARGGVWADFGAGTGTFTLALAEMLGAGSTVYAVDDDANAIRVLRAVSPSNEVRIVPVKADFSLPLETSTLGGALLDGILFANSLHFVGDAVGALTSLAKMVCADGRVVVVEYDRRGASRWVPHPIPAAQWPGLAAAAGLVEATITARRPSQYSGSFYVGVARKP
jgi:ubiquinone/menaquinone biosynthesis C-methylase UbiE